MTAPSPNSTFRNTAGEMMADETLRSRPRARWPLVFGGLGLVGLLAAGALVVLPSLDGSSRRSRRAERAKATVLEQETSPAEARPAAPRIRRKLEIRATPAEASITVDDVSLGRSPALFEPTPGAHQLIVAAPGHQTVTVEFSEANPPPALIELAPLESPKVEKRKPSARSRDKERSRRPQPDEKDPEASTQRGANNSVIIE